MKTNYIILLLLIVQSCMTLKAQSVEKDILNSKENTKALTFQVCDVKRAKDLIPAKPYREVICEKTIKKVNEKVRLDAIEKMQISWQEKRKLREDASYQPEGVPVQILEDTEKKDIQLVQTYFHPFVATLHHAYAKHYPVTISPDMIWLLIAQGFANHVNQNQEEMRDYFVDFEGKKDLVVERRFFVKGSPDNNWKGVFAEFSVQIEENTGGDLLELVTGDFSTTTAIEKAAFEVTLMDAMKSYFNYTLVTTTCGIPEITLEGTVEDWQMIESKAQELAQYNLGEWIDELMPVLQEFTAAAGGKVDKDFWESIYKWNHVGSGTPYITGWILKFFPYKKVRGEFVPFLAKNKEESNDEKISYNLRATTNEFSDGISRADMLWYYHGVYYSMELVAGFVGFHQDAQTLSLRPEISWAVIDKNEKPTKERIDSYHKGGDKKYLESINKQ